MPRRGTELGIRDNFLEGVKPLLGLKASVGKRNGSWLPLHEEARARNAQDERGCWMGYHVPVMPAVGKWREDGQGFKVILNYTVSSGLI